VDDPLLLRGSVVEQPIAVYSGEESLRRGVSREQAGRMACTATSGPAGPQAEGYFDFERFAVDVPQPRGEALRMERDESPRARHHAGEARALKPVYGGKTVTAGNAPGLNDGAAFLMLCQRGFAAAHGLEPLARIVDYVQVCGGPTSGTSTPATAIRSSPSARAARRPTGISSRSTKPTPPRPWSAPWPWPMATSRRSNACARCTNAHGGAVALGHPLGASGARIVMTLCNGLRRRGGGVGVAAICGGLRPGDALMVEVA